MCLSLCCATVTNAHTNTHINAGHETTAATLGFTLYYIATHPEVEARVLEEIDGVLGSRNEPTVDDIPKLVRSKAGVGMAQRRDFIICVC